MPLFRSLADPARRLLGGRLARLRDTLDRVGGRLREAIALAVSRAAAGAVREAVAAILADPDGRPPPPPDDRRPPALRARGRPLWPPAQRGPGGHPAPEDGPDAGWDDLGALDDPDDADEADPAWLGRRSVPPDPPSPA